MVGQNTTKSDIGNIYNFLNDYFSAQKQEFSFLSGKWADFEQWKTIARAKVFELLNYYPDEAPLNPQILQTIKKDGYRQEEVEFDTAKNIRVRGSLLIPENGTGPFPAVVALHDHGGFYYFGREKIIEQDIEPKTLREFKKESYNGHSWASELCRRNYVVLSIDGFYFGSRKLDLSLVAEDMFGHITPLSLKGLEPGSDEYIDKYNEICWHFENLVVRHILMAGTTWPGILFHDDRKSIDYLFTRKEVDKTRIGCCGLSVGGFRSAHLAGLDCRISCAVAAGWMPTGSSLLYNRLRNHTFMVNIPGLARFMDIPDVVSLTAPGALFIQQCSKDTLYHLEGMQAACDKISRVYEKLGIPGKFKGEFYDNGHEFNARMQKDAFEWLDKWLK